MGPASESMPTLPLSSRFAVTVQIEPGPGHEVDPRAGADAVGEHRDRLGAADGVHLVDAEQRARREDRRVRQAAVLLLRRRRQRDRADAGHLGGDDVHQHAGDQRRDAAGHVEADPVDRHLAVGHAWHRRRARWSRPAPARPRRWPAAGGSTPPARPGCRGRGWPARPRSASGGTRMSVWVTPSYCSRHLQDRLEPAGADRLADRVHRRDRRLDVEVGARHQRPGSPRDAGRAGRSGASCGRFYEPPTCAPAPDEGWTALRTAVGSRWPGRPTTGSPAGR